MVLSRRGTFFIGVALSVCFFISGGCGKRHLPLIFSALNPHIVDRIVLHKNGSESLIFTKLSNKVWTVETTGQRYYADYAIIYKFLTSIADARSEQITTENENEALNAAGLKGTDVTIRMPNQTVEFSVKKAGADYESCFILLQGDKNCMLCRPYLVSLVNDPVRKWVKKTVFDSPFDDITSIQITLKGKASFGWKRADKQAAWEPISPTSPAGSSEKLTGFYDFLHSLRIHDAVMEQKNESYGMESPALVIQAVDFNNHSTEFKLGNWKNNYFCYAIRSSEEQGILLFSRSWIRKCDEKLKSLFNAQIELK